MFSIGTTKNLAVALLVSECGLPAAGRDLLCLALWIVASAKT